MNNNIIFEEQNNEYQRLIEVYETLALSNINQHISEKDLLKPNNLIENEKIINNFITEIRFLIQEKAFNSTVDEYRSPMYHVSRSSINSTNYTYDYERTIKYQNLERLFHKSSEYLDGFTLIYRSGMSVLSSIINLIFKFYNSVNCISHIGYYESMLLLNDFKKNITNVDFNVVKDERVLNAEFYFIEFVKANFNFETIDFESFITKIPVDSKKLIFLVFDISFLGDSINYDEILNLLKNHNHIITIFYRSGLKLDQEGFDLINLGIASLYLSHDIEDIKETLLDFMQSNRSYAGTSLSLMELDILKTIIEIHNKNYAKIILENTAFFFSQLNVSDDSFVDRIITADINYTNISQYSTPYFFIKLKSATEDDYINISKLIKYELRKVGLDIGFRTSFGFRNISFEYIKNKNVKNSEILKIVPGLMKGYTYYKMIDILNGIFTKSYDVFKMRCNEMLKDDF